MPEITLTETLQVTSCWCGVNLAIPDSLYREAHDSGHAVYCPLGHTFVYGNTWKKRAEEEEEKRRRAEQRARASRELLEAEERSHAATRGHLTRTKKRVANGVCPCCNRSFVNLRRHMDCKHPEYANPTLDAIGAPSVS